MLNTKQDAAKNSASLEFLKNRWLSAYSAYKQVTLLFLHWLGHRLTSTWRPTYYKKFSSCAANDNWGQVSNFI